MVTAIRNRTLNLPKERSHLLKKRFHFLSPFVLQSWNTKQISGGPGQWALQQLCYPVTPNKAPYKYGLRDAKQRAELGLIYCIQLFLFKSFLWGTST